MIKLKNILEFHHGKAPSAKDPKKDGNKRVFQGKGYRVTLKKDKNYMKEISSYLKINKNFNKDKYYINLKNTCNNVVSDLKSHL